MVLCLLGLLLGALYGVHCFWRGLAPFAVTIPSFLFNCFLSLAVFMSRQLRIKCSGSCNDAVPFIHLSILYCSSQPDHEFFHHSLDSIRVVIFQILTTISVFFFQLHQMYGRFLREWLTTLQFPQGKEASGPGVWMDHLLLGSWNFETTQSNPPFQPPWWPSGSLNMFHLRSHLE